MKKPLVIVDNDPEFKALEQDLEEGGKMFLKAKEFFRKQQENKHKELVGTHWTKIEETLKARNLLPEDFSDNYGLGFQDGVLYLISKDETSQGSFQDFLNRFFKSKE
jgi:hypothetical protein